MSALTPCNLCSLNDMRRQAAKRGVEVIVELVPAGQELAGWTSARYSDQPEALTYFLVLPDQCECD